MMGGTARWQAMGGRRIKRGGHRTVVHSDTRISSRRQGRRSCLDGGKTSWRDGEQRAHLGAGQGSLVGGLGAGRQAGSLEAGNEPSRAGGGLGAAST